ncbi:sulfate transporter 1.3-like isoform X2 [Macadamia integrifolia]|uniref:sulfate transporter 1.3-like isoform X2 n=1 Tax=Macadamia integrifolia TaxID=60698 RepID=UPI001C4F8ABB|nr:sulfate transporter 1.3-like isoform X2 [Macadamia integrifolia]
MAHSSTEDLEAKEMDVTRLQSSHIYPDDLPYVPKVGVSPRQNLFKEITAAAREMFFPDDPLGRYRGQSQSKKFILGLQSVFPILEWGRDYSLIKLKGDLIAGLTIASLSIPQGIGYAKLANLSPKYGLYSGFVPPLVYAFLGSSREIAIGPVAVVSLLMGSMLRNAIDPVANPAEYTRLAFTATFFAGITQAALGFLRLGFLIDFLSHATIIGFMGGAAITIGLQQLKGFLGINSFTTNSDIVSVLRSVFSAAHHGWSWQNILIGASFLIFLLITKYIGKKNKKLFLVSAIAPLTSLVLATFFVYITKAENKGVITVNTIQKGINPSSANELYFTGKNLMSGIKIGVVTGMIALTESIAIGRTFASVNDYQLDGNKEMMSLGVMNIIGSITSCYVTTGSFSRSAVNNMAGCKTAASNIVMAIIVLLVLELITPVLEYTPNAVISAIIISAVVGLIDIEAAILVWKIDKFDFIACLGAFIGTVFESVEIGLLIAVCISFVKILLQVTRPRIAILGNIPRTTIYRNIRQYPEATKVPGVLILRVDSALYFSNSNYVRERILRWLTDEDDQLKAKDLPRIQHFIFEMSPVSDIDTSGIHSLEELNRSLQKRNVQLVIANPGPVVMEKLHASKFTDLIGNQNIFLTVKDAVATFAPKMVEEAWED